MHVIKVFETIDKSVFFFAKIAMFIMMILTTLDAIMRYVFNSPIVGAYHLSEKYLMVIIVFLSMSYVYKLDGHIRIDTFTRKFPIKLKTSFEILHTILAAILMGLIAWQSFEVTYEAYVLKYVATGLVPWPTWLSWVWVPIGSFLFTIRLFIQAISTALSFNTIPVQKASTDHVDEVRGD